MLTISLVSRGGGGSFVGAPVNAAAGSSQGILQRNTLANHVAALTRSSEV